MYRPGFWGPSHAGGAGPTPLSNGIVAEPDAQRADFLLRSAPQGREQGAELLLDGRLVRVLKRGGDLRAQHVAVAAAEPLHRKSRLEHLEPASAVQASWRRSADVNLARAGPTLRKQFGAKHQICPHDPSSGAAPTNECRGRQIRIAGMDQT